MSSASPTPTCVQGPEVRYFYDSPYRTVGGRGYMPLGAIEKETGPEDDPYKFTGKELEGAPDVDFSAKSWDRKGNAAAWLLAYYGIVVAEKKLANAIVSRTA